MVLDQEEIENDAETVSLQRKRRRRASIVYPEEVKRLFRKSELAEKTDLSFQAPVVSNGQKGTTPSAAPTSSPPRASAPPPVTTDQEQGARFPLSRDHGNIYNVFPASIRDPDGKGSVTIGVLDEFHILPKQVRVANYLKALATEKDWRKMNALSVECLINNNMHLSAHVPFIFLYFSIFSQLRQPLRWIFIHISEDEI